jgi:hypothetical protein
MISDLTKKGKIKITFIDTPIHRQTVLYAQYFLYSINDKRDFHSAMKARTVLFNAAKENITDSNKLEKYLQSNGIQLRRFDTKSVFASYSGYLKQDGINSTPTLSIYNGQEKKIFKGTNEILQAMKMLAPQN